jgi:hypothetical protein
VVVERAAIGNAQRWCGGGAVARKRGLVGVRGNGFASRIVLLLGALGGGA